MKELLLLAYQGDWEQFDLECKAQAEIAESFHELTRLYEKVSAVLNAYCGCATTSESLAMMAWFKENDPGLASRVGLKF